MKLTNIILFALLFVLMGQAIPNLYYRFFDKTVYYAIQNPVEVNKEEYCPCESVRLTFIRNVLVTTSAKATVELILKDADTQVEVDRFTKDLVLDAGQQTIKVDYQLPCTLESGDYFYNGVVDFSVRGYPKTSAFKTQTFKVTNLVINE